jgi:hypothetical protein
LRVAESIASRLLQLKQNKMENLINEKEQALIAIGFFCGGLTDIAIDYYYKKLIK